MATSLLIIAVIIYAGFIGRRRGLVLVGLELISFAIAATAAFLLYKVVGSGLQAWLHISLPLANVAAFVIIWIVIELTCAALVHFLVVPKLTHKVQFSKINRIGGAIGSGFRAVILISLALIIFSGLPVSAAVKQPVTDSYVAQQLLAVTSSWQSLLAQGLGSDLGASLTTFTVKADPESTERIQLGFMTTDVKGDPTDENADLALINHERTSRGLNALTMNLDAQVVARAYAKRMMADGVFSHVDADGNTPFDRMKAGGVKFGAAGENLALAPTLQLAHTGLMNSPGHKANILSTSYKKVGIGIVDGGQYGIMVVQDFTD